MMKKSVFILVVSAALLCSCASSASGGAGNQGPQADAAIPSVPLKTGVLSGHTDFVRAAAFSPDGLTAVTGSTDKTIILWDLVKGKKMKILSGHSGFIQSLAFSADGKTVLSGSSDSTAKLWNIETGEVLRTFRESGSDNWIYAVAFAPGGKGVFTGSGKGLMKLWDIATGAEIRLFEGHGGKYPGVDAIAVSPDGKFVASGSWDQTIRIWNIGTGETVRTITGFTESVEAVAFSPDGKSILAGTDVYSSKDESLRLFDAATGKLLASMAPGGEVRTVAFSPDGKTAIAGGARLNLWDMQNHRQLRSFSGHELCVNAVALSPDGTWFLSASDDETVRVWNARETPKVTQVDTPYGEFNFLIAEQNVDKIYTAAKWLATEKKDQVRYRIGLDAMLAIAAENPDPAVRKDAIGEIAGEIAYPIPSYMGPDEISTIYATAKAILESDVSFKTRQGALDVVYALAKATREERYIRDILAVFRRDGDVEVLHLAARQIMWLKEGGMPLPADTREIIEGAARRFLTVQKINSAWAAIASSGYSLAEYRTLMADFLENAMPDRPFSCWIALGRIEKDLTYKEYAEGLKNNPDLRANLLVLRYLINKSALDPQNAAVGALKSQEYTLEQQSIDRKAESEGSLEEQLKAKIANIENQNMTVLMEGSVDAGMEEMDRQDIQKKLAAAGGYPALLKPLADMTDPAVEPDAKNRLIAWKALARCYQDEDGLIVDKLPPETASVLARNAAKEKDAPVLAVAKIVTSEMAK